MRRAAPKTAERRDTLSLAEKRLRPTEQPEWHEEVSTQVLRKHQAWLASRTKASGELDSQVDVAQDEDDGPQVCTAEAKRLQMMKENMHLYDDIVARCKKSTNPASAQMLSIAQEHIRSSAGHTK